MFLGEGCFFRGINLGRNHMVRKKKVRPETAAV